MLGPRHEVVHHTEPVHHCQAAVADTASLDKTLGVLVQGAPPKLLPQQVNGPLYTRMAGEAGVVGPLEKVRPEERKNEELLLPTCVGPWLTLVDSLLYLPCERSDEM